MAFLFQYEKICGLAETHRIISDTYGKTAISERCRREWLQRFKSGDFAVGDGIVMRGGEFVEDVELEASDS
nr:Mariner Mos1 transposase [Hymenolepis microstoma]